MAAVFWFFLFFRRVLCSKRWRHVSLMTAKGGREHDQPRFLSHSYASRLVRLPLPPQTEPSTAPAACARFGSIPRPSCQAGAVEGFTEMMAERRWRGADSGTRCGRLCRNAKSAPLFQGPSATFRAFLQGGHRALLKGPSEALIH